MPPVDLLLRTAVAIAVLAGISTAVYFAFGVRGWPSPASAVLRAGVQMAALCVVLTGIIGDPVLVGLALAVMFAAAVVVSTRRAGESLVDLWRGALALAAGVGAAGGVVFLTGSIESTPRYLLAVGAVVPGSSMTVASRAGRRFAQLRSDRWERGRRMAGSRGHRTQSAARPRPGRCARRPSRASIRR